MSRIYLTGQPGTGKTTRLTGRMVALVEAGVRPDRILALLPQQAAARRLRAALAAARGNTRGEPAISTIYGLAQQHVALFFPLIAEQAGFAVPGREPVFLTVESAQYFLNLALQPERAAFDDLKLHRPRVVSQLLDNLNKSAEAGFGLNEIASRLQSAWTGEQRRSLAYRAAENVALEYRAFCLKHSLIDFSLTIDLFARHLLRAPSYRDYISARFRHVLVDNIEEGVPVLHDFSKCCWSAAKARCWSRTTRAAIARYLARTRPRPASCGRVVRSSTLPLDKAPRPRAGRLNSGWRWPPRCASPLRWRCRMAAP